MKVVLNSDIGTLGRKGDVVEVAGGYARNYLLPKNLAISATKGAVKQSESMQRARRERDKREQAVFEALSAKITGSALQIKVRAGTGGHLFGSVTTSDIAAELSRAVGETIDRKRVSVAEPIRTLGSHQYSVHLHSAVVAKGTIEVVSDGTGPVEDSDSPASEESPAEASPVTSEPDLQK